MRHERLELGWKKEKKINGQDATKGAAPPEWGSGRCVAITEIQVGEYLRFFFDLQHSHKITRMIQSARRRGEGQKVKSYTKCESRKREDNGVPPEIKEGELVLKKPCGNVVLRR